ncbi:MAG: hypothetical protein GY750_14075 [Lentisphaerae bacterium]|nr:hypothetical protein [Lentisphaerota bacterium]MCP4102527.1 hypothetical protein [Lentisphaerota bacterium]
MYKLRTNGVIRIEDGAVIPNDSKNRDWQIYQAWLAAGNTPEAADIEPTPRRMLTKLYIVDRMHVLGKDDEMEVLLNHNAYQRRRWNAIVEGVYIDDPVFLGLLQQVGVTLEQIIN